MFTGNYTNLPTANWMRRFGFTPPKKDETTAVILDIVVMPRQSKFMIGLKLDIYPETLIFNSSEWTELAKPQEISVETIMNAQTMDVEVYSMDDIVIPD